MIPFLRRTSAANGNAHASKLGHIGLEFARDKMHLVQLHRRSGEGIRVRARASIAYDVPREELLSSPLAARALIRKGLKSDRFKGRSVTSALPSQYARIMSVSYQAGTDGNDDAAIVKVMESRLPESLDNYVIDYLPVRSANKQGERLSVVAVAPRGSVLAFLELLRRSGLQIHALEIGPAAIKRLVTAMSDLNDPENVMVINFGDKVTYLTLVSGRRLLFDQEVSFGEQAVLEHVAQALEIPAHEARALVSRYVMDGGRPPPAEGAVIDSFGAGDIEQTVLEIIRPRFSTLLEEIKRTLMYAAAETRGQVARRIYVVGSIARWRNVDRMLADLLEIEVHNIPDPLAPFSQAEATPEPEIAVATGLALRGMFDHG